ncbi:hypothetical protein TWF481_005038 [Arthrobotrys musiformis]|uniref:Carboxylic ester hydrolase n=1 Tax=Arthrobotrys musiformis TaxID=47236 RepID=A0AAV9WN55_9PEZI
MHIFQITFAISLPYMALAGHQKLIRSLNSGIGISNVTVNLSTATVIGAMVNGVESFAGIPFASPPTGNLRLRPPQRLTKHVGVVDGTGVATACPQQVFREEDLLGAASLLQIFPNFTAGIPVPPKESEDCLTVTVTRPEGVKAGDNLPVLFWIYGGSFEIGFSAANDPANFLHFGIALNKPFIFVAVNYRVNGFGFLPGKEILAEGSGNLGLLDQRMGLEWVADNISEFGGDPNRVVIWGISAGSISVLNQLTLYNGNHTYGKTMKPLFRGAVMSSGSIIPTNSIASDKAQAVYDRVVKAAGCSNARSTLQCLREVSYETFMNAVSSEPGPIAYNGFAVSYLPRPDNKTILDSPERLIADGNYAAVPMILGSMEDEGTFISLLQPNLTTTALLAQYLRQTYFWGASETELVDYINTYGRGFSEVVLGSPFRTGARNEVFPGYKRRAAIIGDFVFTLTRRITLLLTSFVNPNVPAWSYLGSFAQGTPYLGTGHGSDMTPIFSGTSTIHAAYRLRTSLLNFIYDLNPNEAGEAPFWPQWGTGYQQLQILPNSSRLITDNYRSRNFDWILNNLDILRV